MTPMSAAPAEDPLATILDRILAAPPAALETALELECDAHPALASKLRARIRALAELGLVGPDELDSAGATIPDRLGEFALLERIGGGGMGVVFRARQEALGRDVALKILRPEFSFLEHGRARLRREVEAIARLAHPGIVPIHTFGEAGGITYYAMELVRGGSLQDVVDGLRGRAPATLAPAAFASIAGGDAATWGTSWSDVVARILLQAADALAHAHARGIVHRDVKPSNLMAAPDGSVRLVDFGLAQSSEAERLTRTGAQLGSLPYSSPEQVRGEPLDGRTDVWSLGVVGYELLALEQPFLAPSQPEILRRVVELEPPELTRRNPAVHADLAAVVHRALEKELERRYPNAEALAADLRAFLAGRPVTARRPSARERLQRWIRREPLRATLAALLLLGMPTVTGLAGYLIANQDRIVLGTETSRRNRIEQALARGFLALSQQHPDHARGEFQTVLAEDPANAEAAAGLAACSGVAAPATEIDEAQADAGQLFVAAVPAITRGPRGDRAQAAHAARWLRLARERSPQARPVYYFQSAHAAALAGDGAACRELAAAIGRLWPQDALAQYWIGTALLEQDPPAARTALQRARELSPRLAAAAGNLGLLAMREGDFAAAREALTEACTLAPAAVEPRINLAIACLQLGDAAAATAAIDAALAAAPEHPGAHYNRGIVALATGDADRALAEFTRATELDPSYREAWNNRAGLEYQRDDFAAAERSFRQLAEIAPDWPQAHANYALVLQRRGALREAAAALQQAVALAPRDRELHDDLLAVLRALRDDAAIAAEEARFGR